LRKYFENLLSNKLEDIEEMNKFLDAFDLPKLNQEDTNHQNRSIASNEIEAVIASQQRKVLT
jgi:formiminotetrahydrofolate cyclodeaminase